MHKLLLLAALLSLAALVPVSTIAQPAAAHHQSYDALFDDFDKRRQVLITRFERLREKPSPDAADLRKAEEELVALDREYAGALRSYVDNNPTAKDLMPARFEMTVTLSRLEDRLEDSIKAADEFLRHHEDAELAPDARFIRAQTLFRVASREADALAALELFIEKHGDRNEADSARMMRIRLLQLMDRPADSRRALEALLKSDRVKDDEQAKAYLQGMVDALDWIGRELPAFALKDTTGKAVANTDLAGKPSIIFVWDTTSAPCLGELPFVQEVQKRHGETLTVLGIGVNESQAAFEQWLTRNAEDIKFRNVWIDREEEGSLLKKLNVSVIPFNLIVDAAGKVWRYDVRSDDLLRYAAKLPK